MDVIECLVSLTVTNT